MKRRCMHFEIDHSDFLSVETVITEGLIIISN